MSTVPCALPDDTSNIHARRPQVVKATKIRTLRSIPWKEEQWKSTTTLSAKSSCRVSPSALLPILLTLSYRIWLHMLEFIVRDQCRANNRTHRIALASVGQNIQSPATNPFVPRRTPTRRHLSKLLITNGPYAFNSTENATARNR